MAGRHIIARLTRTLGRSDGRKLLLVQDERGEAQRPAGEQLVGEAPRLGARLRPEPAHRHHFPRRKKAATGAMRAAHSHRGKTPQACSRLVLWSCSRPAVAWRAAAVNEGRHSSRAWPRAGPP